MCSLDFVTLIGADHSLVEQLHTPALFCKVQYLEGEANCSTFELNQRHAQLSSPAEVIQILPLRASDFLVLFKRDS